MAIFRLDSASSDSARPNPSVFRLVAAILIFAVPIMAGLITFSSLVRDNVGGVDGLRGVSSVAVSSDGQNIYAVGKLEDALAVFSRDSIDGSLQFLEVHRDGVDGVTGMRVPSAVTVSPDGRHVYVVTEVDDSLAVFQRNPGTGLLSFAEIYQDDVGGIFGLNGANAVAVTPDDKYVLVTGFNEDTLAIFVRQATSDELAFVDVEQDSVGLTEMLGPVSVSVSPDSSNVYVSAKLDDHISVFTEDPTRDGFVFVEKMLTGLMPTDVALDSLGENAYITGRDWLQVARRNSTSGRITPTWLFEDGLHGADGLNEASGVAVTPTGDFTVVTGEGEHAVALFTRDRSDGYLEFDSVYRDGVDGVDGIAYPEDLAVSPDSQFLYVAGSGDDALAVFRLPDTTSITLSIDDVTVSEGDSDTVDAVFTVSLSPSSGLEVTVDYATADGTATAGSDYVATFGTLTFGAWMTTRNVTVTVNSDMLDELDETFLVNLSNPANATLLDGQGQGTITDDDTAPTLSIDNATVTEGDFGTVDAVFTVSLSAASGQEVTVDYATANGTATAGSDYVTTSGTLTFPAGTTTQNVTVPVNGDTLDELDETFLVNLSNPSNATISDGQGQGTIIDDERPLIVVKKQVIPEGDPAVFTFTGDVAGVIGGGQLLLLNPTPGTYTSTEVVPSGWTLLKCECDDTDSVADIGTATATIELGAGESVICVFTNCAESVASTLDLSGVTVSTTEMYEACDTLTADTFIIESTGDVAFRAGSRIVLGNGFFVATGGEFTAEIVGEP